MKKLFDFKMAGSVLLMLAISLASCKQDLTVAPTTHVEVKTLKTTGVDNVKGDFLVQDGILHFTNSKALSDVLEQLRWFDISERRNFGKNLGFTSMLSNFCDVLIKSSEIEENDDRFNFLKQNTDIITYNQEGIINFKIANPGLASVLDREGVLYVGKTVYKFTDFGEIISIDGDKNKLANVSKNTVSNKNLKILLTKQDLSIRSICGVAMDLGQIVDQRRGYFKVSSQFTGYYAGYDPNTGEPMWDLYNTSYSYGIPYKWKCNIFGKNCSWVNYSTPNTLSVNHHIVSWNGTNPYGDIFSYSNNWNGIDYSGSSITIFGIPESQLSSYWPHFIDANPDSYHMTNTGVNIDINCN